MWRNSSSEINDELYKGYRKGNPERKINEILTGREPRRHCGKKLLVLRAWPNSFFFFASQLMIL